MVKWLKYSSRHHTGYTTSTVPGTFCSRSSYIIWINNSREVLRRHGIDTLVHVRVCMWGCLTHCGWMTHICVGNLTIIGSDNGLSPGRRQAIIWTNAGILSIGPLGTNFNEIVIEIHLFSFKKIHLEISSKKWRPFCGKYMKHLDNYKQDIGITYTNKNVGNRTFIWKRQSYILTVVLFLPKVTIISSAQPLDTSLGNW